MIAPFPTPEGQKILADTTEEVGSNFLLKGHYKWHYQSPIWGRILSVIRLTDSVSKSVSE
ncbi:MAG: hypothetical protein CSA04_01115 [Bacteroidetes bacterium]|nr:MAG: hypothetical protein CSA04_01115 [Bacteroidota bacterium]